MKINYAHIAFQKEGDGICIFHFVGYETMPIEVDLENFLTDVKTSETIGLIGQHFFVDCFTGKDLESILEHMENAK